MGSQIKIYHLFLHEKLGKYFLLEVVRRSFSNANESDYVRVCDEIENKIANFVSTEHLTRVGIMEYLPLGEDLYSVKNGDVLDIYYCANLLDRRYIILGTGGNEELFLEEALEDYPDEVDAKNIYKISVEYVKK